MVRSEVFSWVNLIHKQHIDFMILLDRFYLGTDHLTCKGGGLWFFVSFRNLFTDNTRVRISIFFPEFNIRLYDKNSESDYYFFPPPKSEYFFQQH
jgi:hypothetical protein